MSPLARKELGINLPPEEAERLWPGPTEDNRGVITNYNATGIEDPIDRRKLEEAYAGVCTADRNGTPRSPEDLNTIQTLIAKYTKALMEVA